MCLSGLGQFSVSPTAIYGANASGKSNLISAVKFMKSLVLSSSKDTQANEPIPVEPYRLSTETDKQPSFFEMVFFIEGRRYRYGFEVTSEKVVSEFLYHVPTIREAKLFERREGNFDILPAFKEGRELAEKTRDNALFISVVAQFNGEISGKVLNWFKELGIISGLDDLGLRALTAQMFDEKNSRDDIVQLVRKLDVGISDVNTLKGPAIFPKIEVTTPPPLKAAYEALKNAVNDMKVESINVITTHPKFNSKNERVAFESFDIDKNESEGTKKIFSIAGPLVIALRKGQVLFVDELDARLHPLITQAIIRLFNSNETNPRNAQLIFATHDVNLLSKEMFRRDQIWFVEKDRLGVTHLFSLAEYKIRNDASFERDYLRGKYGAIPIIRDVNSVKMGTCNE